MKNKSDAKQKSTGKDQQTAESVAKQKEPQATKNADDSSSVDVTKSNTANDIVGKKDVSKGSQDKSSADVSKPKTANDIVDKKDVSKGSQDKSSADVSKPKTANDMVSKKDVSKESQDKPTQADAKQEPVAPTKSPKASLQQESLSTSTKDQEPRPRADKASVSKLAILCLLLILILAGAGGWAAYSFNTLIDAQHDNISQLTSQNNEQKQEISVALDDAKLHSEKMLNMSEQFNQSLDRQQQTINVLQGKILELGGQRPNDWLLAEANYLVRLAGRKLWQEKDQATASRLLATADMRINEMNDPSLFAIRQALANDIAMLQALPRDKSEDLALKLDGLISQVDGLKLNMVELPTEVATDNSEQLSDSPQDWQENLKRMWHSFSDGFITVRRRNGSVEPLMSPKQQWYLEENLKSKLLQAQLAVYRQQQASFEHSIELATRWVMQFFDRQDSTTEFMLSELAELGNQQISVNYPAKLSSSNLIIDALTQRNIGYNNKAGR